MTMTIAKNISGQTKSHHMPPGSVVLSGEKKEKSRMVRLTVNLPSHLVEQMRDAVYWTPGLTLAWMIARAVRGSLTELESVNQGPFPARLKPLRAGRPRLLGQSMAVQKLSSKKSSFESADDAGRRHIVSTPSKG